MSSPISPPATATPQAAGLMAVQATRPVLALAQARGVPLQAAERRVTVPRSRCGCGMRRRAPNEVEAGDLVLLA